MDIINNLLFTALNNVGNFGPLNPGFVNLPVLLTGSPPGQLPFVPIPVPQNRGNYYSYHIDVIQEFCAIDDSDYIDDAIQKHWADMVFGRNYTDPAVPTIYSAFRNPDPPNNLVPPYHIIYAYLVENTRAAQIFERLVYLYLHDEKLKKATTPNRLAFQWIMNTEDLFFKGLSHNSYRNITSQIRSSIDATRRNAYYRLLGMDLAFGDSISNTPVNFYKAEFNNQPFIILFEKFLTEVWQAYTNARNQVGANTTDMFSIVDTAQKIQEMLMSRRTTDGNFANYRYFNLSREEYASVVMMSWFYEVISYDSPLIEFLRCNGNTPGERLINIGNKVGLPAHSKSEGLLDIAPPMNTLLRRIELGDYNVEIPVRRIIESQTTTLAPPATPPEVQALTDILSIINNWEKATGHRIKNPEARLNGTLKIEQKTARSVLATN
jgi:hypothetical protein